MIDFIDDNRHRWGVEPICRVLPIAASTYYAAKKRPTALRTLRDEDLKVEIERVWEDNFKVYGARKIWIALNREGIRVARCTVARLMRQLGIRGAVRGKTYRTTWPHEDATERSRDLVERAFNAPAPNRLWVADVTYARTLSGVAYVCLIIDCFARMIVGWQISRSLKTELCLDALEHAVWVRGKENLDGLVHHSDRGVQFLSIRYTERVAEIGAVTSVGSRGDSFDNALAESVIGLYKTECARNGGVPRGFDDLELRTLEWIDWWNHRRLLEPIGDVPPAEAEAAFYSQGGAVTGTATQGTESL